MVENDWYGRLLNVRVKVLWYPPSKVYMLDSSAYYTISRSECLESTIAQTGPTVELSVSAERKWDENLPQDKVSYGAVDRP